MEFDVSDEIENYVTALKDNEKIQETQVEKFKEIYKQYKDMDTTINNMEADLYGLLSESIKLYVDYLIDKGFFELSIESFVRDYVQNLDHIDNACMFVESQYGNIVLTQKQQEEYRRARKELRGRWVGGGFGISGAIKGATIAGAANAVSGMGHSVFNMVGNIGSSISASNEKKNLYDSSSTIRKLLEGLMNDILEVLNGCIRFQKERMGIEFKQCSIKESETAANILKNIKDRNLEEDVYKRAINTAYSNDPYNADIYLSLLDRYGDEEKELNVIADFFGFSDSLQFEKNLKLRALKISPQDIQTFTDAKQALEKAELVVKKYGIDPNNPQYKAIQNKYLDIKKAATTFEGVTYPTVEAVQQAKSEKKILDEIITHLNTSDFENMKKIKSEIDNAEISVYPKWSYIAKIEMEMDKLERQQRTFNGIEYPTVQDAGAAQNESIAIHEIKEKITQGIAEKNKDKISAGANELRTYQYKYLQLDQDYLKSVDKIIKEFDFNTIWDVARNLIGNKDHEKAIQVIQNADLTAEERINLFKRLDEEADKVFEKEKKAADSHVPVWTWVIVAIVAFIGAMILCMIPILGILGFGIVILIPIFFVVLSIDSLRTAKSYRFIKKLKEEGYWKEKV